MPETELPATLRAGTALVALQALGLVAVAVFYLVELMVSTADDLVRVLVTVLLAVLAAAGLALVARGLGRRRRWARSPALVTNLLALPVAWGLLQGRQYVVGLLLGAWAVAVLVLLFAPATNAALED